MRKRRFTWRRNELRLVGFQGGTMSRKVTIIMGTPDPKKHSTCFHFAAVPEAEPPTGMTADEAYKALKNASFYIPKPLAENSKRVRITIEELAD